MGIAGFVRVSRMLGTEAKRRVILVRCYGRRSLDGLGRGQRTERRLGERAAMVLSTLIQWRTID